MITALLLALALSSTRPPPAVPANCTDEVIVFSLCLPFISSPPNNLSSSPSSQCCHVFSSAFNTGAADCLCYFVRQPLLLGFPLNSTRLLSLSSLCPPTNSGVNASRSLESICSGSSSLPPLQGIKGPRIPKPHESGSDNSPPPLISLLPPAKSLLPDSAQIPPTTSTSSTQVPCSSLTPTIVSYAGKQIVNCEDSFFRGLLIFLVLIFTNL